MIDLEQLAQESAIWPWIDNDCMADPCSEDSWADNDLYDSDEDNQ